MKRFTSLAIATLLGLSLCAYAQSPAAESQAGPQTMQSAVDQHMQMLTEKLDLTTDQQTKMKPILQRMLDGREKVIQDASLSSEQREQREKDLHDKADKQARTFLNDDQKKKLDELESQMHP